MEHCAVVVLTLLRTALRQRHTSYIYSVYVLHTYYIYIYNTYAHLFWSVSACVYTLILEKSVKLTLFSLSIHIIYIYISDSEQIITCIAMA